MLLLLKRKRSKFYLRKYFYCSIADLTKTVQSTMTVCINWLAIVWTKRQMDFFPNDLGQILLPGYIVSVDLLCGIAALLGNPLGPNDLRLTS